MHHVVWPEAGAVYGDNVDDTVGVRAALVAAERCIEASTRLPSPLAVVLVYRWNDGQFQSRVFSWADDRSALEAALRERAAKHVEQACGFISEFQSEGARVVGVLVAEDDDWCPTVRRILVEVIATTNAPGGAA
jgi:hypothetical protein